MVFNLALKSGLYIKDNNLALSTFSVPENDRTRIFKGYASGLWPMDC